MFKKRLVRHGNSDALVINASLIKMLDIIPRETFVDLSMEGDCLIVRRVGGGRRKSSKRRAAHGLLQKLEALAAAGLTRGLFKRMSRDGKSLQEVSSNVMHGVAVDPVTIVRIEDCFERRKNCRESWDATVTAVLARRTRPPDAVDDNSDGDNSEADNFEADNSKRDNSKADNSDGDNSEADNSKADNFEADNSKGDNSKADNSDGDNSEADNSDGDNSEADDDIA